MGWWKTQHGTIGDGPADIMDAALKKIESEYLEQVGRLPTQGELANLIEFTTCGCLSPACGDPAHPFTKATLGDDDTPRAKPRGEQGAAGPCSINGLEPGKLANVDPTTMENLDAPEVEPPE